MKKECEFCKKEIEAPDDTKMEHFSCYDCFEKGDVQEKDLDITHVDVPKEKMETMMEDYLVEKLMAEVFPDMWSQAKEELKDMPRKDSVKYAFVAGARSMFSIMKQTSSEK